MPQLPQDSLAFATQVLNLRPDPVQARILTSNPHRLLLNCSRQWGKSTITAAKALHQALTQPGSLTLIVSPSGRQSAEFLHKLSAFVRSFGIRPRGDGSNEMSLLLPNHSRIVGLPGVDNTIRGFSAPSLVLIDEASRVPDSLYLAVRPMLAASNGQLWLISTPNGRQGFFYDIWSSLDPNWTKITVPATECPRIRPAFLEEERRAMPARFFEQEYLCRFLEPEDAVYSTAMLEAALADIPRLFHMFPPYTGAIDSSFFFGLDIGQRRNFTALAIIERARYICGPRNLIDYSYPTEIRYSVRHLERLPLGTPYPDIVAAVRALTRHPALGEYKHLVVDATGVGQPVVDMLRRADLGCFLTPVTLTSGGRAYSHGDGWSVPRHELLTTLEIALQQGQLKISNELEAAPILVQELRSLRRKVKDSGEESIHPWRTTQHDDFVFATALAHWRAVKTYR